VRWRPASKREEARDATLGTHRGGERRKDSQRGQVYLELKHISQGFYVVQYKVWALLGRPRNPLQEFFLERFKGILDRLDLRLIQESITLSAHSWLFLGSSRTSRLNLSHAFSSNLSSADSSINLE
jgi:hypothetical protein